MSVAQTPAFAQRRWRSITAVGLASLAVFALSLAPAEGSPLRKHKLHQVSEYSQSARAQASGPTASWTQGWRKPIEIFGQKVDVP
jgi:hypothetical protein